MQVEWYGQSSFRLTDGSTTVVIRRVADMVPMSKAQMRPHHPRSPASTPTCSSSPTSTSITIGVEAVGGDPAMP
jgi:hypothetical protein